VFSFDKTTPSGNASPVSYTWNLKPGTYIYQSGANPSVQVQMGLYGKVQKDAALKNAYGSAYDRQISVILSEIDPKHHAAISGGNYGPGKAVTSTIGYDPRYYLVNGQPYSPSKGPFTASPGQKILMRFLNAGFEDRFLVIEGTRMSVIAEDGNKLPFPKNTYSLLLPAGKTLDVLVGPLAAGYYSIYERGIASNQMLAYLKVSSPTQRSLNVSKTGSGRVEISSLPGGVYCGPDCTENFNGGTAITLVARPFAGKTFLNWGGACAGTDPTCVLTMNANKAVTANFSP
jgi:FtsP/CotA-like multicopper oxidase with cupredoxin domain